MKIVQDSRAPNPRRVRIFLAEKSIDVPYENLDIMAQEHKLPERARQNPMTRVPYLVLDDGTVIAETMAICRYFEAQQPEPSLFGRSAVEQGLVEMWQRRVEINLLGPVAHAFRHTHPKMAHLEVPQVADWGKANVAKVETMLDFLNDELAQRAYVAGEAYSVADITALCTVDFMKVARFAMADRHEHLRRWHALASARPSAGA